MFESLVNIDIGSNTYMGYFYFRIGYVDVTVLSVIGWLNTEHISRNVGK